jgi:hypothetical protein
MTPLGMVGNRQSSDCEGAVLVDSRIKKDGA